MLREVVHGDNPKSGVNRRVLRCLPRYVSERRKSKGSYRLRGGTTVLKTDLLYQLSLRMKDGDRGKRNDV